MKRLKLNRKRSRDQIRYRLHTSIQAAAYLADDPSREDIDRELEQIMTAGRPKSPLRSAATPEPDRSDREDSGITKADREARHVVSDPHAGERITAPGRERVLAGNRTAVMEKAWRPVGFGLITGLSAVMSIAVDSPVIGEIVAAIVLTFVLTVVCTALLGSAGLSERAFRLLRWMAARPEPTKVGGLEEGGKIRHHDSSDLPT